MFTISAIGAALVARLPWLAGVRAQLMPIALALLAILGLYVTYSVRDYIDERKATVRAETVCRAEALEVENAALIEANRKRDEIISLREVALSNATRTNSALATDLRATREKLSTVQSRATLLIAADDGWLLSWQRSGRKAAAGQR